MDINLDKHYFSPHNIEKLHLEDAQCTLTPNKTHYNIKITPSKTCLKTVTFNSTHAIYSNVLHYVLINFNNMATAGFGFGGKMEGKKTLQCSQERNFVTSSSIGKLTKGYTDSMRVSSDVVAASFLPKSKSDNE